MFPPRRFALPGTSEVYGVCSRKMTGYAQSSSHPNAFAKFRRNAVANPEFDKNKPGGHCDSSARESPENHSNQCASMATGISSTERCEMTSNGTISETSGNVTLPHRANMVLDHLHRPAFSVAGRFVNDEP